MSLLRRTIKSTATEEVKSVKSEEVAETKAEIKKTSTVEPNDFAQSFLSEVEATPIEQIAENSGVSFSPETDLVEKENVFTQEVEAVSTQETQEAGEESLIEEKTTILPQENQVDLETNKTKSAINMAFNNLEEVETVLSQINSIDIQEQIKRLEDLQKRKQKVESEVLRLSVMKEQAEKELQEFETEIKKIEGVSTIEDYANHLLSSLKKNDLALKEAELSISEAEDKIIEIKNKLAELDG